MSSTYNSNNPYIASTGYWRARALKAEALLKEINDRADKLIEALEEWAASYHA